MMRFWPAACQFLNQGIADVPNQSWLFRAVSRPGPQRRVPRPIAVPECETTLVLRHRDFERAGSRRARSGPQRNPACVFQFTQDMTASARRRHFATCAEVSRLSTAHARPGHATDDTSVQIKATKPPSHQAMLAGKSAPHRRVSVRGHDGQRIGGAVRIGRGSI